MADNLFDCKHRPGSVEWAAGGLLYRRAATGGQPLAGSHWRATTGGQLLVGNHWRAAAGGQSPVGFRWRAGTGGQPLAGSRRVQAGER